MNNSRIEKLKRVKKVANLYHAHEGKISNAKLCRLTGLSPKSVSRYLEIAGLKKIKQQVVLDEDGKTKLYEGFKTQSIRAVAASLKVSPPTVVAWINQICLERDLEKPKKRGVIKSAAMRGKNKAIKLKPSETHRGHMLKKALEKKEVIRRRTPAQKANSDFAEIKSFAHLNKQRKIATYEEVMANRKAVRHNGMTIYTRGSEEKAREKVLELQDITRHFRKQKKAA